MCSPNFERPEEKSVSSFLLGCRYEKKKQVTAVALPV